MALEKLLRRFADELLHHFPALPVVDYDRVTEDVIAVGRGESSEPDQSE